MAIIPRWCLHACAGQQGSNHHLILWPVNSPHFRSVHWSWKHSRRLLWRYYRNALREKWWVILSSGRTTIIIFFSSFSPDSLKGQDQRTAEPNQAEQSLISDNRFQNRKFCRATSIPGNFLLNYFMSTQWTQVLSLSFFKPSNTRTQKPESFSCTVRNHLWPTATNCGKKVFRLVSQ